MKYKVGDKVLLQGVVTEQHYRNYDFNYDYIIELNGGEHICVDAIAIKDTSKTYEDGLADAWELARKICGNSNRNNNYTGLELESIFGNSFTERIIDNHTYQEALAKIEAYEKSQQIQVGDVVIDLDGDERVVLHIDFTGTAQIFSKDGVTRINKAHLKKTGRHIDIEHLLEQIRGNE